MDEHQEKMLADRIEALLFSEGGPLARAKLSKLLTCNDTELEEAFATLSGRLSGGLSIVVTEKEAALVVSKEAAPAVEEAYASERDKDIGDAGLEVLAILLYRGPSTRATIDYIRGVNSSFSIRALLTRGLVERTHNPDDSREYLYRPTTELLAHLGTSRMTELPDYGPISAELKSFMDTAQGAVISNSEDAI